MLLARSRIETIPTTASPPITGRCRKPPNSIRLSASATVVSGPIVTGSRDIHLETDETLARSALEEYPSARRMSRSVKMPTRAPS